VEQAFDHGVNYFYWGSLRRKQFGAGLRRLAPGPFPALAAIVFPGHPPRTISARASYSGGSHNPQRHHLPNPPSGSLLTRHHQLKWTVIFRERLAIPLRH
jgi:hypothetical protein